MVLNYLLKIMIKTFIPIFFAPSMYEAGFISAAHAGDEIEKTLSAATLAFKAINKS